MGGGPELPTLPTQPLSSLAASGQRAPGHGNRDTLRGSSGSDGSGSAFDAAAAADQNQNRLRASEQSAPFLGRGGAPMMIPSLETSVFDGSCLPTPLDSPLDSPVLSASKGKGHASPPRGADLNLASLRKAALWGVPGHAGPNANANGNMDAYYLDAEHGEHGQECVVIEHGEHGRELERGDMDSKNFIFDHRQGQGQHRRRRGSRGTRVVPSPNPLGVRAGARGERAEQQRDEFLLDVI